jgi:transcriptional regulator with XRE-family HTH domain
MLGTSDTIREEFAPSYRAAIRPYRHHKRSDECRLNKAKQNKFNYRRRKVAGLCSYGHCPAKTEQGHTHCRKHLQAMSKRATKRRDERIAQGLCIYCGERPQFWGRTCIICRQLFAKDDPLPRGAKRALRLYREAAARRLHEQIEKDARTAALELLSSKGVRGKQAEALRLYAGIDTGEWRTYDEVGHLMNISKERVRQLLAPSKLTLSLTLSDRVPWQSLQRNGSDRDTELDISLSTACTLCNNIALKVMGHGFYLYEDCGLSSVVLSGLTVDHCQNCNTETVSIPHIPDLHRKLARTVLVKPAALTGGELRFLRTVAGLSTLAFAEQLGVAIQTIQAWERSEALRYLNDLGARIVVASLIAPYEDFSSISKMLRSIRARKSEPDRVSAHWTKEEVQWVVTSSVACDQRRSSRSPNAALASTRCITSG